MEEAEKTGDRRVAVKGCGGVGDAGEARWGQASRIHQAIRRTSPKSKGSRCRLTIEASSNKIGRRIEVD